MVYDKTTLFFCLLHCIISVLERLRYTVVVLTNYQRFPKGYLVKGISFPE